MKIKNSTVLFTGLVVLLFGVYIGTFEYFEQKKDKAFTDMNLLLYESEKPEVKNDPVEPINPDNLDNPDDPDNSIDKTPRYVYDFIAELEIPKINLKRGFVSVDSPYNNVDHNITIIGGSNMPDVEKGNLILAAHSGICYYCYFNQLYMLEKGDEAIVTYNDSKYTYEVVDIYNVFKNGQVTIRRNKNKNVLTLITCTRNSDTEQTVYILELTNVQKY